MKHPFEHDSEYLTFRSCIDGELVADKTLKSRNNGAPVSGYAARSVERVNVSESFTGHSNLPASNNVFNHSNMSND